MPIRFRCTYCNRLLGIATRKAGTQTTCPHCGNSITVPLPNDAVAKTEHVNLDDVDELLKSSNGATVRDSAVAAPPVPKQEVLEPEFEELPAPAAVKAKLQAAKPSTPAEPRVTKPSAPEKLKSKSKKPVDPNNPPLFENDIEDLLGATSEPEEEEEKREKKRPTSGADARSLGDDGTPRQIVLSPGMATLLMAAITVLLALAFVAGYFLAPKG